MDKVKLLLACALVGVSVALMYILFENGLHYSISYVWETVFDTGNVRWLIVPLCIVLSLVFFGLQHWLDPKSEGHEEHSLGGAPISPTIKNLLTIMLLGYFSLLAGASLGPEAVLVPACTVIGAFYGVKLYKKDKTSAKVLVAAAVMALMTAFFHSLLVGIMSLLFVTKQAKIKISPALIIIAIVTSASSYLTLAIFDPTNRYFNMPELTWRVAAVDIFAAAILIVLGYISTLALKQIHQLFVVVRKKAKLNTWWKVALVAGLVLSLLYVLGGPLIEFTGNETIKPLMEDAANLGYVGLLAIYITKLLAIGWSRALGYRGGLIFPMIFVGSSLVAITQVFLKDANFAFGLAAAMIGILAAEKKAKVLL